jgi:Tfp pilus assembly protein PilF
VKPGAGFCPECGAPIGTAPAEGSDAAIYPELARVNLLRLRGDYKAAQDHCRAVLRKFPNNVTANQLLGDLCQETGDLSQAKEWYELALDIAPNHAHIQQKL